MKDRSMLYGVKPTRIFINGKEKEFLFQQDIGPFLRALGYAYSNSDINKLCSPSVNEGPPIAVPDLCAPPMLSSHGRKSDFRRG